MQQVESDRIEPSMEVREEVERLVREQLAVTFPDGPSDLDARRSGSFHESVLDERPARPRALSYLRTRPVLGVSRSGMPKDARIPVHSAVSRVDHPVAIGAVKGAHQVCRPSIICISPVVQSGVHLCRSVHVAVNWTA